MGEVFFPREINIKLYILACLRMFAMFWAKSRTFNYYTIFWWFQSFFALSPCFSRLLAQDDCKDL